MTFIGGYCMAKREDFFLSLAKELVSLLNIKKDMTNHLYKLVKQYPPQNFSQKVYFNLKKSNDPLSKMLFALDLRLYYDDLIAHHHAKRQARANKEFFDDIYKYIFLEAFCGPFEDALKNASRDIKKEELMIYKDKYLPYYDIPRKHYSLSLS